MENNFQGNITINNYINTGDNSCVNISYDGSYFKKPKKQKMVRKFLFGLLNRLKRLIPWVSLFAGIAYIAKFVSTKRCNTTKNIRPAPTNRSGPSGFLEMCRRSSAGRTAGRSARGRAWAGAQGGPRCRPGPRSPCRRTYSSGSRVPPCPPSGRTG